MIGPLLRGMRETRKMSRAALARASGLDVEVVKRIEYHEQGDRILIRHLEAMARALDCRLEIAAVGIERTIMAGSIAELIQKARWSIRLSGNGLARQLGIAQPLISNYETGREIPRVSQLKRILGACGYWLDLRVVPVNGN